MINIEAIDLELTCIAQAIYHEAHTESLTAQLGVAYVILNRMKASHKDACEIVFSKGQFEGISDMVTQKHEPASKEDLLKAKRVALNAWYKKLPNPIGNARYFHDDSIRPTWAYRHSKTITLDHLIFY